MNISNQTLLENGELSQLWNILFTKNGLIILNKVRNLYWLLEIF